MARLFTLEMHVLLYMGSELGLVDRLLCYCIYIFHLISQACYVLNLGNLLLFVSIVSF